MPGKGYTSVSVPTPLILKVKAAIVGEAYTSTSDFIRDAIRQKLERL